MRKTRLPQSFTLIELMVVVAVIMILMGILVGSGRMARLEARKAKAKSMIASLEIAIGMYHSDTGVYPTDDAGSGCTNLYTELVNGTAFAGANPWHGPYMEFKDSDLNNPVTPTYVKDPYGYAYNYAIMNKAPAPPVIWGNINSYNLWSKGPDGLDNSIDGDNNYGDDIYNW